MSFSNMKKVHAATMKSLLVNPNPAIYKFLVQCLLTGEFHQNPNSVILNPNQHFLNVS